MSSECSELSPKMFIEDPESRAKPNQKGYFILKRELIAAIAIIFVILGIPLVALSVHSLKERNVLNGKIDKERNILNGKIDKERKILNGKIDKERNILNGKIDLLMKGLKNQNETINGNSNEIKVNSNEIKVLEYLKTFYGFERIGKYGYFQKLNEKMTYEDGQKNCSKIFGHLIEFNETSEQFPGKVLALIKKFDLKPKSSGSIEFFVGLTDYDEEGVWKWASSGKILNCTKRSLRKASNCKPYPWGPWGKNEPNGKKKEDCASIEVRRKYSWDDDLEWYMNDIACSTKSNIVCQKSFHHNDLDVDDLPKN